MDIFNWRQTSNPYMKSRPLSVKQSQITSASTKRYKNLLVVAGNLFPEETVERESWNLPGRVQILSASEESHSKLQGILRIQHIRRKNPSFYKGIKA
jgi:hypothetical protein